MATVAMEGFDLDRYLRTSKRVDLSGVEWGLIGRTPLPPEHARSRSPTARRITRWAMEQLWAPVGTGVRPQSETDFVVTYLFSDRDGAATLGEMQDTMAELPGLGGSRFFHDAAAAASARTLG